FHACKMRVRLQEAQVVPAPEPAQEPVPQRRVAIVRWLVQQAEYRDGTCRAASRLAIGGTYVRAIGPGRRRRERIDARVLAGQGRRSKQEWIPEVPGQARRYGSAIRVAAPQAAGR